MGRIGVIVGELVRLACNGISHFSTAITNVGAIQAGKAVDVLAAGGIGDTDALPGFNDGRITHLAAGKVLQVSERVQYGAAVLGGNEVDLLLVHYCSPVIKGRRRRRISTPCTLPGHV
ncbi:hypothetical protein D3C72_2014790 [compost metagenome]